MGDLSYDSTADTLAHIRRVQQLLGDVQARLQERGRVHDMSKLETYEKGGFDHYTPLLRNLTYGSEEYQEALKGLGSVLRHHYEHNSHHPEHYSDGIAGMSVLDLIEMVCDWKAASERHADGDIAGSLRINTERFGIDSQLATILRNTVEELGFGRAVDG